MAFTPQATLVSAVASHIEEQIIKGQLVSGQRIVESSMAKELSVSSGSLREALLLLEKRHMVKNIPRKGTFVTEMDRKFVTSLYEALILVLQHTGDKFARNCTQDDLAKLNDIYSSLATCYEKGEVEKFLEVGVEYAQASMMYTDNYFLTSCLDDLWPSAKRCGFVAFKLGPDSVENTLRSIKDSIDAIQEKNFEALREIICRCGQEQSRNVIAAL